MGQLGLENKDGCRHLGERMVVLEQAFPAQVENVVRLTTAVSAIDAKLDSTSQVLDQKVELT